MRRWFAVAVVLVVLAWGPVAYAFDCVDENGERVPCHQPDPPGSGGGGGSQNYCWTQSCAVCVPTFNGGEDLSWECLYEEWNGGCACWIQNGSCSPNGICTYVP